MDFRKIRKMKRIFYLSAALFLAACATPTPNMSLNPPETQTVPPPKSALPENPERSIFYKSNEIAVPETALAFLKSEGAALKSDPKAARKIVGYTDDEGASAYNLAIAQKRIDEVVKILKKHGARPQQLQTYAVGKEKSFCFADLNCKAQMRRVDVEIVNY